MVRIRRKLDSETLCLPELRPLIGKIVEITIQEETTPDVKLGGGDWDATMNAARTLDDYEFDGYQRQREYDLQHAKDHLP